MILPQSLWFIRGTQVI